jgi:hypothetical protein
MINKKCWLLLCSAAAMGCSAAGDSQQQQQQLVRVTVRNYNWLPGKCMKGIATTPTLSVFDGDSTNYAIPYVGSVTFDVRPYAPALGAYMFTIQDNGWYWRTVPNPYTGQMADHAGFQVYIPNPSKSCAFHTGPSFGTGSPPADKVLHMASGFNNLGHCEFLVTRQWPPGLCITDSCMDCSRDSYAKDACGNKYGVVDSSTCGLDARIN